MAQTLIAITNPTRSHRIDRTCVPERVYGLKQKSSSLTVTGYSIKLGLFGRDTSPMAPAREKKKKISAFDALSGAARNNARQNPLTFF